MKKKVMVILDEKQHDSIRLIAYEDRKSISEIVREAIAIYLIKYSIKK